MNNIYTAETDSGRKEDWKTHTWFFFCFVFSPLSHTFSQKLRYYRHLPLFSFLPQRTLQIPLNLMTSLFLLPWPVLWPTEKISLLSRCISIIVCHSKESLSVSLTIFSLSLAPHTNTGSILPLLKTTDLKNQTWEWWSPICLLPDSCVQYFWIRAIEF